jgi:hypothetical protein
VIFDPKLQGTTASGARVNPDDPRSPPRYYPCPRNDGATNTGFGLISASAAGPLSPATAALESGGNSQPVFLSNGTVFFVSAGGVHCIDPKSGAPTGLCPPGCLVNSFVNVRRAETLDAALAGNYTPWFNSRGKAAKLGGTNNSVLCVSWEDQTLYIDKRGYVTRRASRITRTVRTRCSDPLLTLLPPMCTRHAPAKLVPWFVFNFG